MPGLFVETVVLVLPDLSPSTCCCFMGRGDAAFGSGGAGHVGVKLVLAGPITVVPLLAFALAARRLNLSTVGMLQFIAPTLQFLIGVYYGEQLTPAHIVSASAASGSPSHCSAGTHGGRSRTIRLPAWLMQPNWSRDTHLT